MNPEIIDRGRGPEIVGTRITVYDIWGYAKHGWHEAQIAATLRLSSRQVSAALAYIKDHKDEVMNAYREMIERDARGNPPEIGKKLEASHEKLQEFVKAKRNRSATEIVNEGSSG